jgi:LysR family glycine cleavage system transcriptional activator
MVWQMRPRLPPLNALRAFEAAARNLSVTKAADELCVTPAAVTQQLKILEDALGRRLIRRVGRGVELTENGQQLFPVLCRTFSDISSAVTGLTSHSAMKLRTSFLATVAQRWLAPRLIGFRQQFPDIAVAVSTSFRLVDFAREDIDVALRLGYGSWPGLHSTFVMNEELFPVCSPTLLREATLPAGSDLLRRHSLVHTIVRPTDWHAWHVEAGLEDFGATSGFHCQNSALALEMAEYGLGLAIGRTPLVISALASGRLVAPFAARLSNPMSYYLVCQDTAARRPEIARFRDWIVNEGIETMEAIKKYIRRSDP